MRFKFGFSRSLQILEIEKLTKEGNTEDAQLIASGGMTAADYYKAKYTNKAALALELAKDPYKGSFRQEVNMNGKKVPVLFAAGGEPIFPSEKIIPNES